LYEQQSSVCSVGDAWLLMLRTVDEVGLGYALYFLTPLNGRLGDIIDVMSVSMLQQQDARINSLARHGVDIRIPSTCYGMLRTSCCHLFNHKAHLASTIADQCCTIGSGKAIYVPLLPVQNQLQPHSSL
jgi:hypothetical protein